MPPKAQNGAGESNQDQLEVAKIYPRLMHAYLRGDLRAGEELAALVRDLLLRRLRGKHSQPGVAEELAQECLIHIFARLSEFDAKKGCFEAWVSGFAQNALRSHRRRELRMKLTSVPVDEINEPSYAMTHFEDERDILAAALSSLEKLDQELLHMRFSLGMSSDEIAKASSLNAPQVRKRISRAVERLRRNPGISQLIR